MKYYKFERLKRLEEKEMYKQLHLQLKKKKSEIKNVNKALANYR